MRRYRTHILIVVHQSFDELHINILRLRNKKSFPSICKPQVRSRSSGFKVWLLQPLYMPQVNLFKFQKQKLLFQVIISYSASTIWDVGIMISKSYLRLITNLSLTSVTSINNRIKNTSETRSIIVGQILSLLSFEVWIGSA